MFASSLVFGDDQLSKSEFDHQRVERRSEQMRLQNLEMETSKEKDYVNDLTSFRVGYFYFTDKATRGLYRGSIDLEAENNYWFLPRYSMWTNANVIWNRGETASFGSTSKIQMLTLSIGPKEFFPALNKRIEGYLGFGVSTAFCWTKDTVNNVVDRNTKFGAGGVLKIGFIGYLFSQFYFDGFIDYYYQPFFSDSVTDLVNLGGMRAGGSLGYYF